MSDSRSSRNLSGKLTTDVLVLNEQSSDPTTSANQGALYTKDVAGSTELYLRKDSSGAVVQITGSGGFIDAQYVVLSATGALANERVLTGTSNQITVTDAGAGSTVTLSTPQDIATSSSPQFANLSLTGAVNKLTITAPATGSTLTIANGKTLTASNTLTFTGTDSSSVAFGAGGTVTYTSNKLSVFAATTSSELAGVISDETGSGSLVFATSPTLVTPTLGVASATSINFGGGALSDYVPPTTFTPTVTLVGGAGNTVPQYASNSARYTQIGKRVFVDVLLSGDGGNEGAGTGQVNVALPVNASASAVGQRTPSGYYVNGATLAMIGGTVSASASTITLTIGQGTSPLTGADQNSTTRSISLRFDYEV